MGRQIGAKEKALRAQRARVADAPPVQAPLTKTERSRLSECEQIVERGLKTFVEVGNALMEIRDSRLYREDHATWEEYCRERWEMSDRRARQLMAGAGVAAEIGTMVPAPTSERQARPLTRLPPEERTDAWQEAVDEAGGKPSAKKVEEVVGRRLQPEPPPEPEPEPESHEPDPVEEWERAEREVERLQALVDSLQQDDTAKELAALSQKYAQLEGRLRQAVRTGNEAMKDAKWAKGQLRKICETLRVESTKEIIPAIQDLLR